MSNEPWTDDENDRIVADYFAMLASDLAGHRYVKAEHNRQLRMKIHRSRPSIEYKHRNISAVLKGLGETWIQGYRPAFNVQGSLVDAVERWLARNPDWIEREIVLPPSRREMAGQLPVGSAPTVSNRPPPKELEQMLDIARRFDVAERDERNRALGCRGEKRVLAHERSLLVEHGRRDLARRVRWISEEEGDGAGYDILSFDPDGRMRLIEVKTTNGWERTPFYITQNELRVSEKRRHEWRLMRLWDFAREPKAFELQPPLDAHVSLTATTYRASFT